ncbi:hypothetical protein TorRG33x02_157990 [Trema orientale]|uniref:DUF4283 domain-containing protein n=1 Tax=Trema orientale TaxID=63057 RepID=A0A2P5ESA5_TREOI|nr:hypothetical protein TorRG33x02_157990 [Trema orientale]
MDLYEVAQLCEQLNLDDDDGLVLCMSRDVHAGSRERMELCLVRKVLGNRLAIIKGLRRVLKLIWRIPNSFEVEKLGPDNMFLFMFRMPEDRLRILSGGPWSFENKLITLIKPRGLGELHNTNFNLLAFWILIINVPIACMIENCAWFWGHQLGFMEDMEISGGNMRVRVRIDVTVPLTRGIRCLMDEVGRKFQLFSDMSIF